MTSTPHSDTPKNAPFLEPSSFKILEESATPRTVFPMDPIVASLYVPTGNPSDSPSELSTLVPSKMKPREPSVAYSISPSIISSFNPSRGTYLIL